MDWGRDMPQRLDWLGKAWLPRLIVGGAWLKQQGMLSVTPQTRGSVDYPSTRRIQVDVGLLDATSENRAESPLYGELYPNTTHV